MNVLAFCPFFSLYNCINVNQFQRNYIILDSRHNALTLVSDVEIFLFLIFFKPKFHTFQYFFYCPEMKVNRFIIIIIILQFKKIERNATFG